MGRTAPPDRSPVSDPLAPVPAVSDGAFRATLTRRVTFAAAHRYRRPEWDDATN